MTCVAASVASICSTLPACDIGRAGSDLRFCIGMAAAGAPAAGCRRRERAVALASATATPPRSTFGISRPATSTGTSGRVT